MLFVVVLRAQPGEPQPRYSKLEAKVKAAYLLNFTRYVEWPKTAFSNGTAPVVIAVLGEDPLGEVLDSTVRGRTSSGRPIVVRRLGKPEEASSCHLVFISGEEEVHLGEYLRPLARLPVLTVGESEEFFEQGGGIRFVLIDGSVRFQVNLRATQEAGLRISSRMLALATDVVFPEE